jgi:hypothetical protein
MNEKSDWKLLGEALFDRWRKPQRSAVFVLYFFIFIIGIAFFGPILKIYSYFTAGVLGDPIDGMYIPLVTCSLSLSAASFADVFLKMNSNSLPTDKEESDGELPAWDKTLLFFYLCIFMIVVLSAGITFSTMHALVGAFFSFLCTSFGLYLWWQVNSVNKNFFPRESQNSSPAQDMKHIEKDSPAGFNNVFGDES